MRIVTAAQMKQLEQRANACGLSYLQMMENAGTAAYREISAHKPNIKSIVIVAGKGNNGGDGFVIARLAAEDHLTVSVVLAEGMPVTHDAAANFDRLASLPVSIHMLSEMQSLPQADVVVDALYGTGFHEPLRPSGREACRMMNTSGAWIAALDLPSGIHADTGTVAQGAVRAALTITFDSCKPLHINPDSIPFCGEIVCADIGIPEHCREELI
ncbi:MAG TPA: NAD(P)H-hydrate epimerase [Clostridiales bacterium]|nr:NAD(P)H-hydrate epimerase [Clostridiales bacterium]